MKFIKGDIFKSECEAIVNPVNCCGVMSKGLALQFKLIFPSYFKDYQKICNLKELSIGQIHIYKTLYDFPKYIISFPTKYHWKDKSTISSIKKGLTHLVQEIFKYNIRSIAIPALGCGCGNLKWDDVKSVIEYELKNLDSIDILVYEPQER